MANRLAQADALHFLGAAFILVVIFLVFMLIDPVSKAGKWSAGDKPFYTGGVSLITGDVGLQLGARGGARGGALVGARQKARGIRL